MEKIESNNKHIISDEYCIITAGSTYLDIDAYACMVAMSELLRLQGKKAIAYSSAPCNYSVCSSLIEDGQILRELSSGFDEFNSDYIIVDVSDPNFLKKSLPLDRVVEIYDHHVGFESYWAERIGDKSHIEFIGAAATLIFREWKKLGLQDKMKRSTALLLITAILDNTLNLTSTNTTSEDIEVFNELCSKENIDSEWCASYFSEVQASVEADLHNALFSDIKTVNNSVLLPSRIAQLCVWDAQSVIGKLPQIRKWFTDFDSWMINIIDIKNHCSYFVCDDPSYQQGLENVFGVHFESGVAKSPIPYLRKEIIKHIISKNIGG